MPSHSATPNLQTPMPSHPGTSNWQSQMPSHSATPNWQPPIPSHPYDVGLLNPTDQHIIGTLDGSTCPYPAWNDVDWVYMPINAGGNHWVTGAVNLPNSLFYVFDSMHSEGTRLMLEQQIRDWTPVINGILQSRVCFNGTGRQPYNFLFIYNQGLGHTVPQQPNFKDCRVITCWLIAKLRSDQEPIVHGDSQAFWENIRYQMLQMFYKCRCENTRNYDYD
ncbi:phospholipase-like protein [Tanacetum coccineum]